MALLFSDDFERADFFNVPGSPQTGGPYTVRVGTWGIKVGSLYTSSSVTGGVITFPAVRDVDLTWTATTNNDTSGMVFRYIDSGNYWAAFQPTSSTGEWVLGRRMGAANTPTNPIPLFGGPGPVAQPGDVVRVATIGRRIFMFVNGKLAISVEDDPWYDVVGATPPAGFMVSGSNLAQIASASLSDAPASLPGVYPTLDRPGDAPTTAELGAAGSDLPVLSNGFAYKGRNTKILDLGAAA